MNPEAFKSMIKYDTIGKPSGSAFTPLNSVMLTLAGVQLMSLQVRTHSIDLATQTASLVVKPGTDLAPLSEKVRPGQAGGAPRGSCSRR